MSSSSGASAAAAADAIFAYDEGHIAALESDRPWTTQPKFFRHVKISAIASMKMLKHAMTGVEQGRRENGISFEVMGLIVGKPDGDTIIGMWDACDSMSAAFSLLSRALAVRLRFSKFAPSFVHAAVMDAYPLPVKGAENAVVADNAEVWNVLLLVERCVVLSPILLR